MCMTPENCLLYQPVLKVRPSDSYDYTKMGRKSWFAVEGQANGHARNPEAGTATTVSKTLTNGSTSRLPLDCQPLAEMASRLPAGEKDISRGPSPDGHASSSRFVCPLRPKIAADQQSFHLFSSVL